MAIRRFKQIGVAVDGASTARARFRRPSKPIKPGDTVVLQYTDGRIDTVIVRQTHAIGCNECKYAEVGKSCPCYMDQAGFMCCMFGGSAQVAVDVDTVLEDL
jgi:hypothetical protein